MNAILKILNLQLEKKQHGLQIATFDTIDRLDYAGLSIAKEALDPKPLLDAMDELGDALVLPDDQELLYDLARLCENLLAYKYKCAGILQYLDYKMGAMLI